MLTSLPMELISMMVLKDKAEEVVALFLRLGIFHPVDIRQIETEIHRLSHVDIDKEHVQWDALELRLREILRKLDGSVVFNKDVGPKGIDWIKDFFDQADEKISPLVAARKEALQDLKTKEAMLTQVKNYLPFPIKKDSYYTFLEVFFGKLDEKNIAILERSLINMPHLLYPFRKEYNSVIALVIGLKKDGVAFRKVLNDIGWVDVDHRDEPPNYGRSI